MFYECSTNHVKPILGPKFALFSLLLFKDKVKKTFKKLVVKSFFLLFKDMAALQKRNDLIKHDASSFLPL